MTIDYDVQHVSLNCVHTKPPLRAVLKIKLLGKGLTQESIVKIEAPVDGLLQAMLNMGLINKG